MDPENLYMLGAVGSDIDDDVWQMGAPQPDQRYFRRPPQRRRGANPHNRIVTPITFADFAFVAGNSTTTLEQVADALSTSRRTLLRKLESEKIGYQQLLDEARNELACWYLRQSRMPLAHVAEKIGFSDQTNFSRSFKRWKGCSPRDYRRQFAADVATSL